MPMDLGPVDDELAAIVEAERERQENTVSLIASENHVDEAVLRAQGSVFTNDYAEGTPGERYYAGCEAVDDLERLAVDRAKELFSAEHVNVQPHSGTQANLSAYEALLDPGDRILSLSLSDGGHLSHGHPHSLVGRHYDVANYGVDENTGRIDYEAVETRARKVDPDCLVAGYSAYPRIVDWERMAEIAAAVDAAFVADVAHLTGLIAGGVHPSPVGIADVVTCSTHKTIRAGRGGMIMCGDDLASAVDRAVMPGTQGGPLVHNIAGKAAGFDAALEPEFSDYAARIVETATALAETLTERGFDLVSGGTDVHFVLVDFRETHPDLTGERAESVLADVGIVTSKSTVPGEERSPTVGSGIRLGTPPVATRGFDGDDVRLLGKAIAEVLDAPDDETIREWASGVVDRLCEEHPLYERTADPPRRPA